MRSPRERCRGMQHWPCAICRRHLRAIRSWRLGRNPTQICSRFARTRRLHRCYRQRRACSGSCRRRVKQYQQHIKTQRRRTVLGWDKTLIMNRFFGKQGKARRSRQLRDRAQLRIEALEPRMMFDGNGLLLANDAYLTLSFAADGTSVAGQTNSLAAKFNAIAPQSVWENAVLQAFQTWAVRTNVDVGIVPDGGQPLGTPGPTHGDTRFGDIRIAAIAMDPQIGAEATPLDRLVGGTWQADVVFNTNF